MAASSEPEVENVEVIHGVLMTKKLWTFKIDEERHEVLITRSVRDVATVKHGGQLVSKTKMPPGQEEYEPLIRWTRGDKSFVINSRQEKGKARTFNVSINGKTLVEELPARRAAPAARPLKRAGRSRYFGGGGGGGASGTALGDAGGWGGWGGWGGGGWGDAEGCDGGGCDGGGCDGGN